MLKGGVLLAALNARRPTRDIDFAVEATDNDTDTVLRLVQQIAAIPLSDGIEFHTGATAESIRDEDAYSSAVCYDGIFHVTASVGVTEGWEHHLNIPQANSPRMAHGFALHLCELGVAAKATGRTVRRKTSKLRGVY